MDCPDSYHEELLRQSDEMVRLGIVSWEEWREIRIETYQTYQTYLRAVAGEDVPLDGVVSQLPRRVSMLLTQSNAERECVFLVA
jgi:hypothetical protein